MSANEASLVLGVVGLEVDLVGLEVELVGLEVLPLDTLLS